MKAKTVWKYYHDLKRTSMEDQNIVWLGNIDGSIWFNDPADVRWLNCYGYPIGDVSLWDEGKILGDAD